MIERAIDTNHHELIRIQRRADISALIKTDPIVASGDPYTIRYLSGLAMRSTSESILPKWRVSFQSPESELSDTQRAIKNLPDEIVLNLQNQVDAYQAQTPDQLLADQVEEVVDNRHHWNDKYEIKQKRKRDLETLRQNGCRIEISPEEIHALQEEYTTDTSCPILDQIKNKRIATINGLHGSKTSLTIHDLFDHFWTYDVCEQNGIIADYSDFLQSVGNPHLTDMFNREGELLASVSFEWRAAHVYEGQAKRLMTHARISRRLGKAQLAGPTPNQERAIALFAELDPEGVEVRTLESMYTNILVELMEQRRKHGYIKVLDRNFDVQGILPLLDAEYLSLIIETNHLMHNTDIQPAKALFRIEAMVEDYLTRLATCKTVDPLTVTIDSINNFVPENSSISKNRLQWLEANLFHLSQRAAFC